MPKIKFFFLFVVDSKVDSEAERQGEMLAFYGEEDTRNYDSPEPGPLVEKDDTPNKTGATDDVQVRFATGCLHASFAWNNCL